MQRQAAPERIEYIRFLSARLWSQPPDSPPDPSQIESSEHPLRRPILFLPEIPKNRIDENQLRIEAAALELFTGFRGTNIRDIATKADVSHGAIYTYYPSKEAIFAGLARTYRHSIPKLSGAHLPGARTSVLKERLTAVCRRHAVHGL